MTVPQAEAFDKAALRDGWASEDFYLLLDGKLAFAGYVIIIYNYVQALELFHWLQVIQYAV